MAERDRPVKDLRVHWNGKTRLPVDGGFVVEQEFTVEGTILDPDVGPIDVEINVEVVSGRALARSVKISSADEVSSTVLRKVAIRELIAWGIRLALKRVNLTDGGLESLVGPGGSGFDDSALAAIKRLVGYLDDEVAGRQDVEYADVQP
jgi:hypothetical protein